MDDNTFFICLVATFMINSVTLLHLHWRHQERILQLELEAARKGFDKILHPQSGNMTT